MVTVRVHTLTVVVTASSSGYIVQAAFHSQAACRTVVRTCS
jgi:hypothetical protein